MDIPDKIYLQIKDEDGEPPDEVTWCVDRIYATDIEYVRRQNSYHDVEEFYPPNEKPGREEGLYETEM